MTTSEIRNEKMADRIVCPLCDRHVSSHNTFVCTGCACSAIYEARFKNAQILLHKETYGRHIERFAQYGKALATRSQSAPLDELASVRGATIEIEDEQVSVHRLAYDQLRSSRAQSKFHTRAYDQSIQELEGDCQDLREDIRRRREDIRVRRETLQRYSSSIEDLKSRIDALNLSTGKIISRGEPLQKKTADSRAYMVMEAANLWGLTVRRKRGRDGKAREMAYIAGLPVPDLRDLLTIRPEQLNATLIAIVYMLNQTCAYLGLRLPSQLLLPDKEHSWPRILPVHSSYLEPSIPEVRIPSRSFYHDNESRSTGDGQDSTSTPEAQLRARPLHLRQSLLKLYAEDMVSYESFVEAMSLLAYDVAWLAKTQGIDVCFRRRAWSWEGACDLGRNLWVLFGPSLRRRESEAGKVNDAAKQGTEDEALVTLGVFSHSTSKNNVAGPEAGILGLREWRLANPNHLIKKVKEALADRKMAGEWELLEEDAWDEGTRVAAEDDMGKLQPPANADQDKPAKGWQKLRPRSGE